jgi:hypothetical protein
MTGGLGLDTAASIGLGGMIDGCVFGVLGPELGYVKRDRLKGGAAERGPDLRCALRWPCRDLAIRRPWRYH